MQRKLDWLAVDYEKPDSYGNVYINMKFDDGTVAYKAGKPADIAQHYGDLLGIKMTEELVEIDLEDTGKKTQKGATKYKLVGYPGWSAPVAQGGKAQANANGKSYGNSWYNSEEGVRFTQERMDRRTALMQAVAAFSADLTTSAEVVEVLAERMYEWLRLTVRGEGQTDAEVPITERTTDPIPASTSPSPVRVGEGPIQDGDEPEGVAVSTGGSRAATPKGAENPWEGMDV